MPNIGSYKQKSAYKVTRILTSLFSYLEGRAAASFILCPSPMCNCELQYFKNISTRARQLVVKKLFQYIGEGRCVIGGRYVCIYSAPMTRPIGQKEVISVHFASVLYSEI